MRFTRAVIFGLMSYERPRLIDSRHGSLYCPRVSYLPLNGSGMNSGKLCPLSLHDAGSAAVPCAAVQAGAGAAQLSGIYPGHTVGAPYSAPELYVNAGVIANLSRR